LLDDKALELYLEIVGDRPKKLDEKESDYKDDGEGMPCSACIHFWYSAVRKEAVCEIVRPENEDIEPHYTCKFFTKDGIILPKIGVNLESYLKPDEGTNGKN
jgi:hypothetical protein